MSFQTVKQSPGVLQTSSSQSHILSSPYDLAWYNSGDSPALISDSQETQLSPLEESLLQETLALRERHFTCLRPHCTFRAQSAQELNDHYNVQSSLHRTTSPQGIQAGLHEQYIRQPLGQPLMQTQPLQASATNLPLDTRLQVSLSPSSTSLLSSSTSSSSSSPELQASSQAMAVSSSRGVNGAFPRPPNPQRVPGGGNLASNVGDDERGISHRQLAELPLELSSFQLAGVADGTLHDRGSVTGIIQPLEKSASEIDRVPDKQHLSQTVSSRANVHVPMERSLSWQRSVNAGVIYSYLATYQGMPADIGAALTMIAAIQTILATFSSAVRIMQRLSGFSQHLLSSTLSFACWRGPNGEALTQVV